MKNLLFSIIIIFLFVGCQKENEEKTDRTIVSLIATDDPIFFHKSVYLVDNKDYLIKTNLETFKNEYPFFVLWGYEQKVLPKVIEDGEQSDSLNLGNYILYLNDSIYIVSHYLESGKCFVYNKKSNTIEKQLELERFEEGDPMQMIIGRRFYIDKKLFLEVVDMISK